MNCGMEPNQTRVICIFGCKAYVHVQKEMRRKLDDKARECIFIGYPEDSKAYRLLEKDTKRVVISRDVRFIEEDKEEGILMTLDTSKSHDVQANSEALTPERDGVDNLPRDAINEARDDSGNAQTHEQNDFSIITVSDSEESACDSATEEKEEATRRMTRTTRGIPPERYAPGSMMVQEHGEPTSIEEALSGPNANAWKNAMDDEIKSLRKNGTWVLQKVPDKTKTIGCKWVFKLKKFADGRLALRQDW